MSDHKNDKPPRLALAFFRWFCHPDLKEDIEGDLLERFHNRILQSGVREARWLFAKDVLLLMRPRLITNLSIQIVNMRKFNWIMLAVISVLLVIVFILPFLPGPSSHLIIGLSLFAQSPGSIGLLLVPVGIIWTIIEIKKSRAENKATTNNRKKTYWLAITATVIITVLCLFIALIVMLVFSISAGILGLMLIALGLIKSIKSIKKLRNNPSPKFNITAVYLIAIPLISFFARMLLEAPLTDYSRNFAIQRGEELIGYIETYKEKEGKYPESLEDLKNGYLKEIPAPSIMGIDRFRYNKTNNDYHLSFSQWVNLGIVEEIVLYDKNVQDNMKQAYDYKLDQHRVKGAFASYDTRYDHWRYYLCD